MATYIGIQFPRPKHATSSGGNVWMDSNKVTPSAALALNDVIVALDVPAGVRLEKLRYYGGDFDTGTTLTTDIGYRKASASGSLTAAPEAFANDATTLRAATTTWQELVFEPVTFNEPAQIIFTVSAAATGVSGTPSLYVQAQGVVVGIA